MLLVLVLVLGVKVVLDKNTVVGVSYDANQQLTTRTSTSVFGDGRISTHADPTSTRRTISGTAYL